MAPALLIGGTLCDARLFAQMAERLTLVPVVAAPISHTTVEDTAKAMLAEAPLRFVAIGFSLGGFVVLEMMRCAPERLLGAVLISSNPHPLQPGGTEARRADVRLASKAGIQAVIDRLWPRYVAPERIEDRKLEALVRNMAVCESARFADQTELAISRPDSMEVIRTSSLPLLALHGGADEMSPVERAHGFAEGPRARLTVLPKVGHFVPLEAPAEAAAAINQWAEEMALCC